jgi:hypothetical protein
MPGSAEANCRNDTVTMNDPTVLENDGDQGDAHPPVFFHNFGEFEMIYIISNTL